MIKAIIVDDERDCCEVLKILLERHCPEVTVEEICYSAEGAMNRILSNPPQLVFLDIEMPHMNGFQLLEALPKINFQVIFTTSYDQYAIKAIRFSALDYLLKPIDRLELQTAVTRAAGLLTPPVSEQIEILMQQFRVQASKSGRVALPTMEGVQLIPIDSIISCASKSNYTILYLKDKQKLMVSRTLKDIEEMLSQYNFLRVHNSFLVNIDEIRKYIRGEGGNLVMSDGSSVDVSKSKKESLLRKIHTGK
jgi:two-component system LytT family response regulator